MKIRNIIKNFIFCLIIVGFVFVKAVSAEEGEEDFISKREDWYADESIQDFEEDYNFPSNVVVIPISKKNLNVDSGIDVRELYYYFATRSGFGDLPFHYIVTEDGDVFVGNKYGDEAKINISGIENSILVGYIQGESQQITISSIDPLKDTILQVSNKYAITPDNVFVKNLKYSFGERAKLEDVELIETSKKWQEDIEIIKESLLIEYAPSDIEFKVELVDVALPAEELDPTSTAEIKIKLKNIGEYNIYSNTISNIYVARNNPFDERSLFHISEEWDSLSRVAILEGDERLVIGEESGFTFNVFVPLFPPEKSEDFILVDSKGNQFADTEFTITLKISSTTGKIIEITDTPTGYLNVRDSAGGGKIITKVSPGERFLVKDFQNGYYKIEANGKEGWVVKTYVKEV